MKKYVSFCTILIGLFALVPLAGRAEPQPENTTDVVQRSMFMWSVEKDGRSISIIGSLHMATEDIYPLPSPMLKNFTAAERVLFEVNPLTMDEMFRKKLDEAGRLPRGRKLKDEIPPDMKERLEGTLRRLDLPKNAADEFKPWFAALMISFSATARHHGDTLSMNHGIDRYFIRETRRSGKEMSGLETTDDQLALFTSLSEDLSLEFLDKTLRELDELGPLFNRMIDAWKNGDDDGLWEIVKESFDGYPEVYQEWLVERNRAWLISLEKLFEDDRRAFVVVGAAHMVGPDGLPELLKARGYNVEQAHQP